MSTRRLLGASCALLVVGGCAAPQRRLAADNQRLSVEVAELRAQTRRDRRQIKDLEHRLLMAGAGRDRAEPVVVQDAPTATPEPPRTLAPAGPGPGPSASSAPIDPPSGEAMTAIGVDDPGVEIVYEGEAAEPTTRRPLLALRERGGRRVERETAREPTIVAPDEALPVVRGEIPLVDTQLRRARSAPARLRGATFGPALAGDPRSEYQRAYAALTAGDHAAAVAGMTSIVARFPDHDLADNAQYWLGESYYDRKDYARAATAFREVMVRYPRGNKVADAMLKLGFCHAAVGKLDDARAVLRQVTALYPKTAPAQLASERLIALGRTP